MLAPTKALMMNGAEVRAEARPRHLRVVMSAMMTWVRSCRPLFQERDKNDLKTGSSHDPHVYPLKKIQSIEITETKEERHTLRIK